MFLLRQNKALKHEPASVILMTFSKEHFSYWSGTLILLIKIIFQIYKKTVAAIEKNVTCWKELFHKETNLGP
jgi:hypothetical protein